MHHSIVPTRQARHSSMVSLVDQMLELHKADAAATRDQPREDRHPAPDRGHGRADRQAGVRIVRAEEGGDRDCEMCE